MEQESPFNYGKLAEGLGFINRTNERKNLKTNLVSGINTMLISPRRWGKSSLVKRVADEILRNKKNIKVCFIDASTILSEEDFYRTFTTELIKATSNKWETWVHTAKSLLSSMAAKISIGTDPTLDFSIGLTIDEIKNHELELLNLPEKIAKEKNIRIIVCIDEFQDLARINTYNFLEKKMRSVWQKQQNTTYCLYGSKRHMMMDIFDSSSKPFYRFGQMMFLKKIEEEDWCNYIVKAFNDTKKNISYELANDIVRTAKSHSWYVQQLSHFVWNLTGKKANRDILKSAIQQVIDTNLPLYQKECDLLSTSQLNLLLAMANGESNLTSVSILTKYNVGSAQNVSKNKKLFQEKDIVEKDNAKFAFLDPIFEIWFRNTFGS